MPESLVPLAIPPDVMRSIRGRLARKRGERNELSCLKVLRENGWSASRSKKGPVDVFAGKWGMILLVQVKSGKARPKRMEIEALKKFALDFNASAEIWYYKGGGKLQRHSLRSAVQDRTGSQYREMVKQSKNA